MWRPACWRRGQGHSVVRPGAGHSHRLLRTTAQPNVGEFVDVLHRSRTAGTLGHVAALPREWIYYVQTCDGRLPGPATPEGAMQDACCQRLLPDEGEIELKALFTRLPSDVPSMPRC